jgi:acylphosphatase
MKVRRHIYFSGRVQGVGFRFQARRLASGLGLTGYVKNLWDGRVEMEAQGEESQITELLKLLRRQPYIEIEDVDISEMPVVEHDTTFGW